VVTIKRISLGLKIARVEKCQHYFYGPGSILAYDSSSIYESGFDRDVVRNVSTAQESKEHNTYRRKREQASEALDQAVAVLIASSDDDTEGGPTILIENGLAGPDSTVLTAPGSRPRKMGVTRMMNYIVDLETKINSLPALETQIRNLQREVELLKGMTCSLQGELGLTILPRFTQTSPESLFVLSRFQ
jgi:hypothetical protein